MAHKIQMKTSSHEVKTAVLSTMDAAGDLLVI